LLFLNITCFIFHALTLNTTAWPC